MLVVAELGTWATQWDALVDLSPLPTPFLRSWWLGSVAVGEPAFVLAVEGDVLVGGAAFQLTRRRGCAAVGMLGDGPLAPDHLDLVAVPGRVGDVVEVVGRWLRSGGPQVIDLVGLADSAWIIDAMPATSLTVIHSVAPYAPLPPTWEEYLAQRPGQVRSTIKRATKRLERGGIRPRRRDVVDVGAVESALEDLRRLHDTRWGETSGFLDAWPAFADAIRAGASSGEVRFTDLVDEHGRVVAIELELWAGTRAGFYQAGRLEDHELRASGTVLKAAVLRDAIADGATEFDLLRGNESYKAEWASAKRIIRRSIGGIGVRGLVVAAAVDAKRRSLLRRERRLAAAEG